MTRFNETCAGLVCPGGPQSRRGFLLREALLQRVLGLPEAGTVERREELHGGTTSELPARGAQRALRLPAGQLVGLGKQHVHALRRRDPLEEPLVAFRKSPARIDDQEQGLQRVALAERIDQRLPGAALGLRSARIAITRKVHQPLRRRELEEVEQPGASRRLAGAGEAMALDDRVDRARLAGVRAPRKRNFSAGIRRELTGLCGAQKKADLLKAAHFS